MGAALPCRSVRGVGQDYHVLPPRHRGHASSRRQQRTCGVAQYEGLLIARRAFGFHSAHALIALSELTLSGLCPSLPGRQSC